MLVLSFCINCLDHYVSEMCKEFQSFKQLKNVTFPTSKFFVRLIFSRLFHNMHKLWDVNHIFMMPNLHINRQVGSPPVDLLMITQGIPLWSTVWRSFFGTVTQTKSSTLFLCIILALFTILCQVLKNVISDFSFFKWCWCCVFLCRKFA